MLEELGIPPDVTLVVVSKGRTAGQIEEVYARGFRDFGENRIEEALPKIKVLPNDIRWHFIGRIQSKKIRKLVGHFSLIHSVDRKEIAEKLSEESVKRDLCTTILLQVNTSGEESKAGLPPEQWMACYDELRALPGIHISGLMTMAPQTTDQSRIHRTFARLSEMRDELRDVRLITLSMGMSDDYKIAIEEGSTMVRLGKASFN